MLLLAVMTVVVEEWPEKEQMLLAADRCSGGGKMA